MPRRHHLRSIATSLSLCAFLVPALASSLARAENASSQAAAQALFDEARTLMNAGKFGEACPKFAESERLDPGAGTLLNLANCYEKAGQTASAWVTFKDAAAAADVKRRADWSQRARERATALEPLLSRLTITVAKENRVEGLEIRRDGVMVGSAEWGVAIPVDPGDHAIEATAPKKKTWSTTAKVGPKTDSAKLEIPKLEDEPQAAVPAPIAATPTPAANDSTSPQLTPGSNGSSQRTIGLVVAGVGVVGLAVGSVFGVMAMGKNSDSKNLCPETTCSNADGIKANDDAKSQATISTIAMAAGGAALVTGAVIFFTAPHGSSAEKSASNRVRVAPMIGANAGGLTFAGAW